MKKHLILVYLIFLFSFILKSQNLDFTAPDTVCVGQSFQIQNSTNANSHLWTICSQNSILLPEGTVIDNPNNALVRPNYIHIEKEGTDYIGFVTNDKEVSLGYITRLNFGNSIKNIPTATNLGNFGGLLNHPAGLTLIKNGNNWHAFLLNSGQSASQYRIVRLDFGNSLNNTPSAILLSSLAFFDYPFEISIHREGNVYVGFYEDLSDNLFRINFGTNITNASPTITNLGNVGSFSRSFKHVVVSENNKWYMLLVSDDVGGGGSVSKLSFGNSLLNTPTGQDLGSLGGLLKRPGSIVGERICDHWAFYITSLTGVNTIKMDFKNGMEQSSFNKNLGNVNGSSVSGGNSNLIIENNEKYVFYVNTIANNLTRTAFPKCNDIGIGPFSIQTPPLITINDTGTFFINYYINQGQITENSICKPIVVIEGTSINLGNDTTYCGDFSRVLSTGNPNTLWSTGQNGASITVNQAGTYWAQVTQACGVVRDSIIISSSLFTQNINGFLCPGDSIILRNDSVVYNAGTYTIWVKNQGKCDSIFVYDIQSSNGFNINLGNDTLLCEGGMLTLQVENNIDFQIVWNNLFEGNSINVEETGVYSVIVSTNCGVFKDTVYVAFENCDCNIFIPNAFSPNEDKKNDVFYPQTECPIENVVFRVFNRWGEKVFESHDISMGWNGYYKGKMELIDSYAWTLEYNEVGKAELLVLKGMVTLIK
ncbi:MAG: gliding motility-associated C-terminal domain-containing protein [Bacteroidetes bacterium]|nr:gliding motility-associated C-terminal domain-containing protein [Bacteroidota bacterium]